MNQLGNQTYKSKKFIKMFTISQENNSYKSQKYQLDSKINPPHINLNSNKLTSTHKLRAANQNTSFKQLAKQSLETQQTLESNRSMNRSETSILYKYKSSSNLLKRDEARQALKNRLQAKVKIVKSKFQQTSLELQKCLQEKNKIIAALNASQKRFTTQPMKL